LGELVEKNQAAENELEYRMMTGSISKIYLINREVVVEIVSIKQDNAMLIRLKGRMDVTTSGAFEQACGKIIQEGCAYIVVDIGGLDYISSAGLRGILGVDKKIKGQGGKLALCNMRGMVKEVFHVSGFAVMFPLFDTAEAALEKR
jgi:anti-sigma B factor antagonist